MNDVIVEHITMSRDTRRLRKASVVRLTGFSSKAPQKKFNSIKEAADYASTHKIFTEGYILVVYPHRRQGDEVYEQENRSNGSEALRGEADKEVGESNSPAEDQRSEVQGSSHTFGGVGTIFKSGERIPECPSH